MKLAFGDFPQLLFPFSAAHLPTARTVWLNDNFSEHVEKDIETSKRRFKERFAYLVPGCTTFDTLALDNGNTVELSGERYGGFGIGDNGGGARCGNIDGLQVKGVGKNLLASGSDIHHSYGGFKAVYAIHEAIYSTVLSRLLPVGVADVHGVILTGPEAAYVRGTERGWGGLMVRDPALRPANFLRASLYSPAPAVASQILSDVGRVRAVNRQLARIGSTNDVIRLFGAFLANAANQFSFARLAGLMHGAVTPSNLCLDGRWIDLTNTSFVTFNHNWAGGNRTSASFLEEMHEPVRIIAALAETFSKFNCTALNIGPLFKYYNDCLADGLAVHLDFIIGLPRGALSSHSKAELQPLLAAVLAVNASAPILHDSWPINPPDIDPMFELVADLFVDACSQNDVPAGKWGSLPLVSSFRDAIVASSAVQPLQETSKHLLFIAAAISATKRAMLKAFFFKGRLETRSNEILRIGDIEQLEAYICSTIDASKWIFDLTTSATITVVNLPMLFIGFNLGDGTFEARTGASQSATTLTLNQFTSWTRSVESTSLVLDEFNFAPYLNRLAVLIDAMNGARNAVK